MTRDGIKQAFGRLEPTDQARLLTELANTLAAALQENDERDRETFARQRSEEAAARPWSEVRAQLRRPRRAKK
jgi:hypothetical protein